jgi:hypothetical protein
MTTRQRNLVCCAVFVSAGAIAGIGAYFLLPLIPRTYVASQTLFIEPEHVFGARDWFQAAARQPLCNDWLREIIKTEGLYSREVERLPMQEGST